MKRTYLGFFCSLSLLAQSEPFFPKPSYFRQHFQNPVTNVELQPPARLEDFAVEGKLELSLKSYLELVMANNPDISIQKLTVEISRNAIAQAFGVFDPLATATFSSTRTKNSSTSALNGANILNSLNQPLRLSYQQMLPTGTLYNISFNESKLSSNSSFNTFNPSFTSNLNFNLTQPLLRNRGGTITRLPITIARSRLRGAEYGREDQIMQLIVGAELAYWGVVEARENVRVAEESLKLADASLKRAQRELELGASSPLDIFQPQQVYANAEFSLTQSRYRLAQAEDSVRRQIGADLDPKYRGAPVVLTEPVTTPPSNATLDKEDLVSKALQRRPDLRFTRQNLDIDDLNLRSAVNGLRPDLALGANYGGSGTGGTLTQRTNFFNGDGSASTLLRVIPGGVGDALGQLFGFGLPTYGFSLTLRLPIRDRAATAILSNATINKKLDTLRVRSLEENVRLQVLNAINNVENSKASVELAKVARDLAQKRADAEDKKYQLGTTVIFFVLQAQQDLTTAESNLVRELIGYRRNQITLLQRSGTLLDERGIVIQ